MSSSQFRSPIDDFAAFMKICRVNIHRIMETSIEGSEFHNLLALFKAPSSTPELYPATFDVDKQLGREIAFISELKRKGKVPVEIVKEKPSRNRNQLEMSYSQYDNITYDQECELTKHKYKEEGHKVKGGFIVNAMLGNPKVIKEEDKIQTEFERDLELATALSLELFNHNGPTSWEQHLQIMQTDLSYRIKPPPYDYYSEHYGTGIKLSEFFAQELFIALGKPMGCGLHVPKPTVIKRTEYDFQVPEMRTIVRNNQEFCVLLNSPGYGNSESILSVPLRNRFKSMEIPKMSIAGFSTVRHELLIYCLTGKFGQSDKKLGTFILGFDDYDNLTPDIVLKFPEFLFVLEVTAKTTAKKMQAAYNTKIRKYNQALEKRSLKSGMPIILCALVVSGSEMVTNLPISLLTSFQEALFCHFELGNAIVRELPILKPQPRALNPFRFLAMKLSLMHGAEDLSIWDFINVSKTCKDLNSISKFT